MVSGEPRDYIEPGTLSPLMVLFQALWLMVLISITAMSWYIYKVTMRFVSKAKTTKQQSKSKVSSILYSPGGVSKTASSTQGVSSESPTDFASHSAKMEDCI
uniref:Uncharacterized protein n=1 Tax=Aplanochytrium stocchinoi TaxID=215587 RepID=A0A7S3LI40_9STRA